MSAVPPHYLRPPEAAPLIYVLRETSELPKINCNTCLKDVLLHPRWLQRCNYVLHKSRRVVGLSLALGCVPMWICGFVAAPTGRILGILALILQTLPLFATTLGFRYDMTRLLTRTYDFWFFTLVNAATAGFGYVKYGDVRGAVPLLSFVGYQQIMLIDANNRGTKNMIVLSIATGVTLMGYAVYLALDMIDESQTLVLFSHGDWRVECSDIVVNGLVTVIMMLLRNAYRKYQMTAESRTNVDHDKRMVRCITYRCRTRLVVVDLDVVGLAPEDEGVEPVSKPLAPTAPLAQLRLVRPNQFFQADNIVCQSMFQVLRRQTVNVSSVRQLQWLYQSFAWTAAFTALLAACQPHYLGVSITAILMASVHSMVCLALCQRQLLRKLLRSFDVWFISVQLTLAFLSVCHLQAWDRRCYGLLSCWLWSHYVLLLDALTPFAKQSLGIQMRLASLVVLFLIVGHLLIAVDLVFLQRWQLNDRILFTITAGRHSFQFRVASFLLSRLFSVFWWCWRLLWRLERRVKSELILIQEALQYEDAARHRPHRRWKGMHVLTRAVAPGASSTTEQREG